MTRSNYQLNRSMFIAVLASSIVEQQVLLLLLRAIAIASYPDNQVHPWLLSPFTSEIR